MNFTIPTGCCERTHPSIDTVFHIGFDALKTCAPKLREAGVQGKTLLVADENTYAAAGEALVKTLQADGFTLEERIYPNMDEAQQSEAQAISDYAKQNGFDAIIAVGTGSLNDTCRYASFHAGIPYAIVATAPSMDGFCSVGAPLIVNGVKKTYICHNAAAIIADAEVMDAAPMELAAAGYGDLLGKYYSLFEWRLANAVIGEYYCPATADIMRDALAKCEEAAPAYAKREPGASLAMMEALILSGVAMALTDSTRPASGAEHHLSHFWEMRMLLQGKPPIYHGTKVGVASVLIGTLYKRLAELEEPVFKPYPEITQEYLEPGFGSITPSIVELNQPNLLDEVDPETVRELWPQIREWIGDLPDPDDIARKLRMFNGPGSFEELGLDDSYLHDGMKYGCYSRRSLTLFRICEMLDVTK